MIMIPYSSYEKVPTLKKDLRALRCLAIQVELEWLQLNMIKVKHCMFSFKSICYFLE